MASFVLVRADRNRVSVVVLRFDIESSDDLLCPRRRLNVASELGTGFQSLKDGFGASLRGVSMEDKRGSTLVGRVLCSVYESFAGKSERDEGVHRVWRSKGGDERRTEKDTTRGLTSVVKLVKLENMSTDKVLSFLREPQSGRESRRNVHLRGEARDGRISQRVSGRKRSERVSLCPTTTSSSSRLVKASPSARLRSNFDSIASALLP